MNNKNSRKRLQKSGDTSVPDLESGYVPKYDDTTYIDKNTGVVHHHHHHHHTIQVEPQNEQVENIGELSGGFETFPQPYTEFSLTSGAQVVIGWIACLFSYVIIGILIWIIVLLST